MIKKMILIMIAATTSAFGMVGYTETRAALDIGSGGTKVTVAEVDPSTKEIIKIFHSEEVNVYLKRDMLNSGKPRFSEEIQQKFIDVLAKYKSELAIYHPVEWSGIATAASRQAENAQEIYDRAERELGIKIRIIPQEEEGRLGFNTALAVSGVSEDNLIAYDSGSGSFQLTTKIDGPLQVIEGNFAFSQAWDTLCKEVRGLEKTPSHVSPNPISVEEAQKMVPLLQARLPKMSSAFYEKMKKENTQVVGIGNKNFIFAMGAIAVGKDIFTKQELWEAIVAHCDKSDDQLKQFADPREAVVGMVLLYSVMDGMGIDELTYSFANGCCEGVLIDPTFWSKFHIMKKAA